MSKAINFKALLAAGNTFENYESTCEWEWMRVWLSFWGSSPILSSSHLLLGKSWGVVVVAGSCGGTDSGTSDSLYPILSSPSLWMWCMNIAWKTSDQLLAGNWLNSLSWELQLLLLLLLPLLLVVLDNKARFKAVAHATWHIFSSFIFNFHLWKTSFLLLILPLIFSL